MSGMYEKLETFHRAHDWTIIVESDFEKGTYPFSITYYYNKKLAEVAAGGEQNTAGYPFFVKRQSEKCACFKALFCVSMKNLFLRNGKIENL